MNEIGRNDSYLEISLNEELSVDKNYYFRFKAQIFDFFNSTWLNGIFPGSEDFGRKQIFKRAKKRSFTAFFPRNSERNFAKNGRACKREQGPTTRPRRHFYPLWTKQAEKRSDRVTSFFFFFSFLNSRNNFRRGLGRSKNEGERKD